VTGRESVLATIDDHRAGACERDDQDVALDVDVV